MWRSFGCSSFPYMGMADGIKVSASASRRHFRGDAKGLSWDDVDDDAAV